MRLRSAMTSLLLVLGCLATLPRPAVAAERDVVLHWNEVAQNAVVVGRPPGSALVLHGIVAVAIYDAVIAVEGGAEPFVSSPAVPKRISVEATVATAARDVLVDYVDDVAGQVAYVDRAYDEYMQTVPDGPATRNGIRAGHRVGTDVLAWRQGDGFDNVVPWVQPPPGPGVFEPAPTPTPVDVKLTQVDPLTFTDNAKFRPTALAAMTSDAYTEAFNEVKAYGRIDSAVRTPAQTQVALFWSENTTIQWPRALRALAVQEDLGITQTARMFALALVSGADSILACFDAKYHYTFWRPFHAVPRADTDGNPATEADITWRPLLMVNHPEYPGAHGCYTTAVTRALTSFFGTDQMTFTVESTVTGTSSTFDRFSEAAQEVYDARTWAGLHFRTSTMVGAGIGRAVERHVARNFFS